MPSKLDAFSHLFPELDDDKLSELAGVKPSTVAKYRKKLDEAKAADPANDLDGDGEADEIFCESCGWTGVATDLVEDDNGEKCCPECDAVFEADDTDTDTDSPGNLSDPSSTTGASSTDDETELDTSSGASSTDEDFEGELAGMLSDLDEEFEGLVRRLPPSEVNAARSAFGTYRKLAEGAARKGHEPEIDEDTKDAIRAGLEGSAQALTRFEGLARSYDDVRTVGAIRLNSGGDIQRGGLSIWHSAGVYRGEIAREIYLRAPDRCTVTERIPEGG